MPAPRASHARWSPLPLLAATATLLGPAGAATAATDPALLGCWRTQQVHATWTDGSTVESNSDCVTEFGPELVHSRCRTPAGVNDTILAYEVTTPGRLHWLPASLDGHRPEAAAPSAAEASGPASAAAADPGADVAYAIDGDFIVTTRSPTLALDHHDPAPKTLQVLSIRVDPHARGGCQPREPSNLRIGRSPRSSLALTLPAGWRPQLADPATTPGLAQSIGNDFFVGAFVPRAATPVGAASASGPAAPAPASSAAAPAGNAAASLPPASGPMVIVLDVTRFGASPVREAEFSTLKRDLAARLPDAEVTCDTGERGCFLMRTPKGVLGYTELVHVAGRAAIVSAVGARVGALPAEALVRAVQAFSERLEHDNPEPKP